MTSENLKIVGHHRAAADDKTGASAHRATWKLLLVVMLCIAPVIFSYIFIMSFRLLVERITET